MISCLAGPLPREELELGDPVRARFEESNDLWSLLVLFPFLEELGLLSVSSSSELPELMLPEELHPETVLLF